MKVELSRRIDSIKRNVKNLLKIAKRDSWVCDRGPSKHGKIFPSTTFFKIKFSKWVNNFILCFSASDYEQVTKFLQGYIDNELNFSEEDTCTNNCEDFTKTQHVRCAEKTLCTQNRRQDLVVCGGEVRDCKQIQNDDIEVCYSDNEPRRYHYVKYSDGKMLGTKPAKECSSINQVFY